MPPLPCMASAKRVAPKSGTSTVKGVTLSPYSEGLTGFQTLVTSLSLTSERLMWAVPLAQVMDPSLTWSARPVPTCWRSCSRITWRVASSRANWVSKVVKPPPVWPRGPGLGWRYFRYMKMGWPSGSQRKDGICGTA